MDKQGLLLCAKYAISPNFFGYCGPDKNSNLFDHLKENLADRELALILSDFETLYPYLQLTARLNKINDPFNHQVVGAYWLGNSLLKPINILQYQAFIKERLNLDKKLLKSDFQTLLAQIFQKEFLPHHAFHVFNVFKRTGKNSDPHTLNTMNECKISWGRAIDTKNLFVETKSLEMVNKKLRLGRSHIKQIKIDYKGKQFIKEIKIGDWISFHWGYICDLLTEKQVKNLEYYTTKAIEFYNRQLLL